MAEDSISKKADFWKSNYSDILIFEVYMNRFHMGYAQVADWSEMICFWEPLPFRNDNNKGRIIWGFSPMCIIPIVFCYLTTISNDRTDKKGIRSWSDGVSYFFAPIQNVVIIEAWSSYDD